MSNRRKLKKRINDSMSLLYNDCILYKVFTKIENKDEADKILFKIGEIHADLLSRVSVTEGRELRGRVKAYYKKLNNDLKQQVNYLGLEIQKLD